MRDRKERRKRSWVLNSTDDVRSLSLTVTLTRATVRFVRSPVNFLQYKNEGNLRELQVMRRYHITNRDDYAKYNRITGQITSFVNTMKKLDPKDAVRIDLTDRLLDKLYDMGVIPTKKSLVQLEQLSTASFCRRRLAVVMVRSKMSETVKEAVGFVEQGHVRVGPETVGH
jgi:U3 small nucleolar ribonucleoprotein protein IMP3